MMIWNGFGLIVPILWLLPIAVSAGLSQSDRKLAVLLTASDHGGSRDFDRGLQRRRKLRLWLNDFVGSAVAPPGRGGLQAADDDSVHSSFSLTTTEEEVAAGIVISNSHSPESVTAPAAVNTGRDHNLKIKTATAALSRGRRRS
jgi:hypothetical protein